MHLYHPGGRSMRVRQLAGKNKLYMARTKSQELDIHDGDWAWVSGHNGHIKVQVALMEGVNLPVRMLPQGPFLATSAVSQSGIQIRIVKALKSPARGKRPRSDRLD